MTRTAHRCTVAKVKWHQQPERAVDNTVFITVTKHLVTRSIANVTFQVEGVGVFTADGDHACDLAKWLQTPGTKVGDQKIMPIVATRLQVPGMDPGCVPEELGGNYCGTVISVPGAGCNMLRHEFCVGTMRSDTEWRFCPPMTLTLVQDFVGVAALAKVFGVSMEALRHKEAGGVPGSAVDLGASTGVPVGADAGAGSGFRPGQSSDPMLQPKPPGMDADTAAFAAVVGGGLDG